MVEINDLSTTDASNTGTGWVENQAPSTVNNAGRADLGLIARWYQQSHVLAVTETGVNSLSVSLARSSLTNTASASGSTGYLNGLSLRVEVPSTVTDVFKMGINGKVKHPFIDGAGGTLSSSAVLAGAFIDVAFDASAKAWRTLGGSAKVPINSIDGTQIAIGSDAIGDIMYYDGTDWAILAAGTDGYHLRAKGAAAPEWEAVTHNTVQVVNTQDGAVATGMTILPHDDTIPQNTEGDEYMTLAITPTSATNKLLIEVVASISQSSASPTMTVALFQDSTADALAATSQLVTTDGSEQSVLRHYMTSGTASETTFKVRIGGNQAGTTTFNGTSGARKYGGVMASSITITEITV